MRSNGLGLIDGLWSLRLSRFATIGLASTLLYAALAFGFSHMGFAATEASVLAFLLAAIFSYAGHKYVTFVSGGSHAFELPRFLALSVTGLVAVSVLPAFLTGMLGLPAAVPFLLACVVIPVVNYIVLGRWVFRGPKPDPEKHIAP
jgi:putative flippase GtrA